MTLEHASHPHTISLLIGAGLLLLSAALTWRRRGSLTGRAFIALMLLAAVWLVSYALELGAVTPEAVLAWHAVRLVVAALMLTVWLIFVLFFAGYPLWRRPVVWGGLVGLSLLTLVLVLTNDSHHLIWQSMAVQQDANGQLNLVHTPGLWSWAFGVLGLGLGITSIAILLRTYRRSSQISRGQFGALVLIWLLPTAVMLLHLVDAPVSFVAEVTPYVLGGSALLLVWSLYTQDIFEASYATYDRIVASMDDGVIVLDANNFIISINPAALALVNTLTLNSIGQSIESVFRGMPELLARSRDTRSIHTEITLTLDTGPRYFDLRISLLEDQHGRLTGRVIVLRDITAQVEAEAQLRTLSRAVEQSGSIIIITNTNGEIEYVNPAFTAVTGYTAAEALHQNPRLLRSGESPPEVYQELWRRLTSGQEWRGEFHNRKKNGQLYWAQAVISPVLDAEGRITHFVAVQDDITRQKEMAERERRQRLLAEVLRDNAEALNSTLDVEEVLQHVLENAQRAIFVPYDLASILLIEDGMARIVRQHRAPGSDVPLRETTLFPVSDLPLLHQTCETGQPMLIPDTQNYPGWRQLPGSEWIRSCVCMPIRLEDRSIGILNLSARQPGAFDAETVEHLRAFANQAATALKNARSFATIQRYAAELEARNRELDSFSHTVAHDLRSPLALIQGYLGLAADEELTPEARQFVEEAIGAAHKMNSMIEALLLFAQVRNGAEVHTEVDLNDVVQAAIERFHVQIEERGIEVSVQPDLPLALGYAPWVEEVVANLVSNAIKYIGRENTAPRIAVRAARNGDVIRCEVQDNGVGINPEDQKRLFEMFARFHHREAQGFGLGLSIVARIVTRLGGQVGVESAPGQGSTFWFTLPAAG